MENEPAVSRLRLLDRRKRVLDLALALPGLALAIPVILAAVVAIRVTSSGPAIFNQVRLGRHGKPFRCHKLRTMYETAPSCPTHELAAAHITPVGKLLRRFKFDELPQLWNVVKGEMSLVGPRPCLPTQIELISHRRRLEVFALLPGITGLAQIRNIDMSAPERCAEADAEYLRSMSVGLDMRLLVGTLFRQ